MQHEGRDSFETNCLSSISIHQKFTTKYSKSTLITMLSIPLSLSPYASIIDTWYVPGAHPFSAQDFNSRRLRLSHPERCYTWSAKFRCARRVDANCSDSEILNSRIPDFVTTRTPKLNCHDRNMHEITTSELLSSTKVLLRER